MRIAVIGSGISGMVSAYLLSQDHDIVLYEADNRIGGHTHTIDVSIGDISYPVDTGFIVFNEETYPNFIRLMRLLKVAWQPSKMSFSMQCDQTGLVFPLRSASRTGYSDLGVNRRRVERLGKKLRNIDVIE